MLQGHNVVFIYENPHTNMFKIDPNNPMFFEVRFPIIHNMPDTFQTGVEYSCGCRVLFDDEFIANIGGKPPVIFHKNLISGKVSVHCPHCLQKIS